MKRTTSFTFLIASVLLLGVFASCKKDNSPIEPPMTPSQILMSTPWETTSGKDAQGKILPITDPNIANFVGFAYFKSDSIFTMYNLDDSPKMHGNWWLSPDGKTRTIVAKDNNGVILFTRVVDMVVLTTKEFTYRVYPDATNKAVYYDVIHTPTNHKEPGK
ncbi:MAG: DUF4822 domain-containing protein [Niabella sp.]|nr:DUF4822 domain-containing protein [Niabella sp.]